MRTVVIDEGFKTRLLRTIAQRKPVEVGALLGRQLPDGSRDFLTLAVALPLPQGKKRIKNEKQGEQEDQKEEGVAWRSLADVSRQTVEAHVKRLNRHIIAGLSICGLYAVSSDGGKQAIDVLQRLWPNPSSSSCSSSCSSSTTPPLTCSSRELTWLHMCTQSSQLTCRVGPSKGEVGAAIVLYQEGRGIGGEGGGGIKYPLVIWHSFLNVNFKVVLNVPFFEEEEEEGEKKEEDSEGSRREGRRKEGRETFFRGLWKAAQAEGKRFRKALAFPSIPLPPPTVATADAAASASCKGGAPDKEEAGGSLIPPSPSSSTSSPSSSLSSSLGRRLDFYTLFDSEDEDDEEEQAAVIAAAQSENLRPIQIKVTGTVVCIACLHDNEGMPAVVHALKNDYARTLLERVEIMWEEGVGGGGKEGGSDGWSGGMVQFPRRVLLSSPPSSSFSSSSTVPLVDYVSPGSLKEGGKEGQEEAWIRLRNIMAKAEGEKAGAVAVPVGGVSSTSSSFSSSPFRLLVLEQQAPALAPSVLLRVNNNLDADKTTAAKPAAKAAAVPAAPVAAPVVRKRPTAAATMTTTTRATATNTATTKRKALRSSPSTLSKATLLTLGMVGSGLLLLMVAVILWWQRRE